MATIRTRLARSLPAGEGPLGFRDVKAAADPGGAPIAKAWKKTSAAPPAPAAKRKPKTFDERLVRERAYAIWIEEGQPDGRDVEHWLKARGEIERDAA